MIVEGRHDARFFANFLKDASEFSNIGYQIYAVNDRVDLPPELVIGAGFDDGDRGRVLTLSTITTTWFDIERNCLTCIADADRAFVRDDLPHSEVLLATDFGSLECYALTERVLSKFIAVVLREGESDATAVLAAILTSLVAIFVARAALHYSSSGYSLTADHIRRHDLSQPDLDKSLIKRALPPGASGTSLYSAAIEVLVAIWREVPGDEPRKAIRGHDIASVLINHLSLRNDYAHPETVERSLMACVERVDIEDYPLFKQLTTRIASAKI